MNKKPDSELIDDDAPEWTDADIKQTKRLKDMPTPYTKKRKALA